MIGQAELVTGTFHDIADGRIMDMADTREQVMLDLVIQSTHIPRNKLVSPGKISRCIHLVHRPGRFELFRVIFHGLHEFSVFYQI